MMSPRSKKFLEELPKNGNKIKPSAIKAGYSPVYAHANGKTILKTAIKEQAKEIIETIDHKPANSNELKKTMYELMGLTKEELYNNAKYILNQEKDLSTRLKILAPLIAEAGIQLTSEESAKVIVPVLNIGVRQPDNGSIEPYTTTSIE
jgi:phage terminase small subunit